MDSKENKNAIPNSVSRAIFVALGILFQIAWIIGFSLRLEEYSKYAQLFVTIIAFILVMRIYNKSISSAYKIAWVVAITILPVFGISLYFLFSLSGSVRTMRKRYNKAADIIGEVAAPNKEIADNLEKYDLSVANQVKYLQNSAGFTAYSNTSVKYFANTTQALEAQKDDLRTAQKYIFIEYHAIEDSSAWAGIEAILCQKAAEGVDVRVFYDDMGSAFFINHSFKDRLQKNGIKCRVFNPLLPFFSIFMNHRDHRKITVIDGKIGYTGGYNLADHYFNITHPYGLWKDSGIRLEGEAVRSLTGFFIQMWEASQYKKINLSPYLSEEPYKAETDGLVIPYADTPLDGEPTGENVYLNIINSAQKYVYIATPYLIISDEMKRALILASKRGVDVRIVTPGIPDKKLVYTVTRSYYPALASAGIRIFEFTPGFMHAKLFVSDNKIATVGTINMDFRSLYLHFENGCVLCYSTAVNKIVEDFHHMFGVSREVTAENCKRRNIFVRLWQSFLRLLSPFL